MPQRPRRPQRGTGPPRGPVRHEARVEAVRVERMAAGGDGIARGGDGRVVFVRGGLPGEHVDVAVHTTKKDYLRGDVVDVLDPSPYRVTPPCEAHSAGCGGCAWQHAAPAAQPDMKVEVVRDALRRVAKMPDLEVAFGGAVPSWGYRTTVRLAVAGDGRVGFRAAASHRVVPVGACPVAHESLSAMLPALRVGGADEITVRVAIASGEATALAEGSSATIEGLPHHVVVGPAGAVHEVVAGSRLRVSAPSFFQSGPMAAELLVRVVGEGLGEALSPSASLLDAYGGVGLFAACLGAGAGAVTLVESSPSSCADARINVPGAEVVESMFEAWGSRSVDVAVADPARAGLGADAVEVLSATGAGRIVLVSCDPVAMARDTALLAAKGYGAGRVTVLDLFPHTPHVEVVTVFDRR